MNMTSQHASDQTISAGVAESYDSLLLELSGPGSDMKFDDPTPGNALYSNGDIQFWYNINEHENVVPQKTPTDLASDPGYPRTEYDPRAEYDSRTEYDPWLEQETSLEAPDPEYPRGPPEPDEQDANFDAVALNRPPEPSGPPPEQCEKPPSYESLFLGEHGGYCGNTAAMMSQCATPQGALAAVQQHTQHQCVNEADSPWKIEPDTYEKIQADASWNIAQAIYKYPWAGSAGFSLVRDATAMPLPTAVAAQAARASAAEWTAHYKQMNQIREMQ